MDSYTILGSFLLLFILFIYLTWFGFSVKVDNEKNNGSEIKMNPFIYTMSCVKSAFDSIVERVRDNSIYKNSLIKQDQNKEIRYSKKIDFNESTIKEFLEKDIDLAKTHTDLSLYTNPFILKNKD